MFDDTLFLNQSRSLIEMPVYLFEPVLFNSLAPKDKAYLWRRARACAIWNRRSALLKAMHSGLQGTDWSDADRAIADINNWFALQQYRTDIDAATGQAVTPLIDPERLKLLAEQNNQAVQAIAITAIPGELVLIGTELANIVSQNVGGPA
jgi:hypothetical protein